MDLAWLYASLDEFEPAERLIQQARDAVPEDPYVHYIAALVDNRSGKTEDAIRSLERAIELGYSRVLLVYDPNFRNIRSTDSFRNLVET